MPKHSVLLVRCALLWFLVGVGLGVAMLLSRADLGWSGVWLLRPDHGWIMLAGFMVQLALGVAHWILPRTRHVSPPGAARLWTALVLLNAGVLVLVAGPLMPIGPTPGLLLHAAGIALMVHSLWPRIQSIEVLRGEGS
ncbi:MAG: hypothetical protein RIE53_08880 [Rhodothermales bacterium]